jgi:sortase A
MFSYRELWMRWIQVGLVLAGLAVLACPTWSAIHRAWTSWHAERLWDEARREPHAPVLGGEPAAWLAFPAAQVDTLVVREGGNETLKDFPSLWISSAHPWPKTRLCLIRAHRDLHFRALEDVRIGDQLSLEWRQGQETEYRVVETEILDPDIAVARVREKADESWLVLMTCYPFAYVGPAPSRFLVWARPVSAT